MNTIISDNSVSTLRQYLREQLVKRYDAREADNITLELFYHYSKWNRTEVLLHESDRVSESELLKYHFALKRLTKGEPLQYVTGVAYFYGLSLAVNEAVLIPRPETEEMVKMITVKNNLSSPAILDIGTGSGCIAIALKKNIESATLTAVDISAEALEVAKTNAARNETDITFHQLDILSDDLPQDKFDIIVSNPPYVLRSDAASMAEQVLYHEPHTALFVNDDDALIFYKRIVQLSKTNLSENGFVCCEMHEGKQEEMIALFKAEDIIHFQFHTDMQNKTRFVLFQL